MLNGWIEAGKTDHRILTDEFDYARMFRSDTDRRALQARWIHDYNCYRHHSRRRTAGITRTQPHAKRHLGTETDGSFVLGWVEAWVLAATECW